MSPLSDTTGISASIVGIDLFEHIKNMMYTTIPAWLISAALMLWLLPNVAAHDMNSVESFRSQLEATGLVHGYSLIPFALLVVLALLRVNAVVAMLFTIIAALGVTYFHSTPDLNQLGAWFYGGYKLEGEAFQDIAKLISRGGLESISSIAALISGLVVFAKTLNVIWLRFSANTLPAKIGRASCRERV